MEALGYNYGQSDSYNVDWWRDYSTIKTFNPKSTTKMSSAANYAFTYLTGWNYSALAQRGSSSVVNCATLVWKAYNSQGVETVNSGSSTSTVLPRDFDESSKLNWVRAINWDKYSW